MNEQKFLKLFHQLLLDVRTPEFYWGCGLMLVIFIGAWWGARYFRRSQFGEAFGRAGALSSFSSGSVERLAFPLISLILILIVRTLLNALGWQHLSLYFLAVPMLTAWVLIRILIYLVRCIFANGEWLKSLERFLTLAVWVWVMLDISGLDAFIIKYLDAIKLPLGKERLSLWLLLHRTVTVGLTLLIALWVGNVIETRFLVRGKMDANLREVLARVLKALLVLLALLLSLSQVGVDVTTLSVFSGAFAVGLGFGLQKIASNYVSGFIILLDRSIRLGNLVAVDDKTTGTVTQITTRYTVLRTLAGTDYIIPNEYLVSNIVRNLSYTDTRVRLVVNIQVGYDTDIEALLPMMLELACEHPRVLRDPSPGVLLTSFGDNGICLELGFWVSDPENGTGSVKSEINIALWKLFREKNIAIPYPQREIRMLGGNAPSVPIAEAASSEVPEAGAAR